MQTLIKILEESVVEGLQLKLPPRQLDRSDYLEVKKFLEGIGGKWKSGKTQAFVFRHDPMPHIDKLLGTGQKVNLKKDFQFFPTPAPLADKLVMLSAFSPGESILEPSAGDGAIIKAIHRKHPYVPVDYCELMPENQDILFRLSGDPYEPDELPNIRQVGEDFLQLEGHERYDCIIANPPFANKQDIRHVMKMFDLLTPNGGRLVAVMSPSWQHNSDKLSQEFRDFVAENDGDIYPVPAGTFKESGTEISTVIVNIWKS